MQFIYHILLIVICVGSFVDCKGGRGGGGRGGVSLLKYSGSCNTHECRLKEAIFGTIFFIGVISIGTLITLCKVCLRSDGHTDGIKIDKKEVLISTDDNIHRQTTCEINLFQSGVWSSQYLQYETWHGPHQFPLLFNSQTMKIKGAGSDHVGIFSIKGFYSTKTNRIVLKKEYKSNTDHDIEKNSRQSVKIKLIWNKKNNQFEGNWYINTTVYRDCGKFNLHFHEKSLAIASNSYGTFNVNTCYTKSLNNYLVVECPSLCPENVINPIATTSSIPQLSIDKFQMETVNHIHSSSERVPYNPQLDTIITLEPDK
ncbi:unnamed protein product [Adineta steineri]|uniref:Uncharacterized protein n=2 Tax=Adineta steineri TaxID=433720 RepID=A0A819KAY5_9BILA|nr:unnamed protein product [Adineta steineri]CAF3942935.1 unnamed protein product [Adineta steineri]